MEFKEPIDQQLLVDSDLIMEPCHVCRCCESDAIPESRLIWGQQHRAVSGTSGSRSKRLFGAMKASYPTICLITAAVAFRQNSRTPQRFPRSVIASARMPEFLAWSTSTSIRATLSRKLYSLCTCKWTKDRFSAVGNCVSFWWDERWQPRFGLSSRLLSGSTVHASK